MNICFYNHWHMGDVFSGRAYVMHIMRSYPGFNYAYAINGDAYAITDLRCRILHVRDLPPQVTDQMAGGVAPDQVWINTWIGAYMQVMQPGECHANWCSLQRQWQIICDKLNEILHVNITLTGDPLQGVPEIDWSCYRTHTADQFIAHAAPHTKRVLVCNGPVRSYQSVWQSDWSTEIEHLAQQHADVLFICTHEFNTNVPNIKFTNHIFQQPCDLNEIAYVSTKCDVIWGKNSGPFMYCHMKDNVWNPHIKFLACSDRPSDSYAHGATGYTCAYHHSLSTQSDQLIHHVNQVLNSDPATSCGIMQVLT
jgi:hypothetical protein